MPKAAVCPRVVSRRRIRVGTAFGHPTDGWTFTPGQRASGLIHWWGCLPLRWAVSLRAAPTARCRRITCSGGAVWPPAVDRGEGAAPTGSGCDRRGRSRRGRRSYGIRVWPPGLIAAGAPLLHRAGGCRRPALGPMGWVPVPHPGSIAARAPLLRDSGVAADVDRGGGAAPTGHRL